MKSEIASKGSQDNSHLGTMFNSNNQQERSDSNRSEPHSQFNFDTVITEEELQRSSRLRQVIGTQ